MCGLFCAFSLDNTAFECDVESLKIHASQLMKYRGPDHFGHYINENKSIFLFHSRLSIRGLDDKYNQPYKCKDHSMLVYNGEIYNTSELSSEFIQNDTFSDTAIFADFIINNQYCHSDVDGMYAYVRYCMHTNKVFFARDLFGEKPLLMLKTRNSVFLFSEVAYLPLISAMSDYQPGFSSEFITRFFTYGYRQLFADGNCCAWEDIVQIKPGSINQIDLNDGTISCIKYESLANMYLSPSQYPEYDYEDLKSLLFHEIAKRQISDVPTGISLSSGIDSNTIASVLATSKHPPSFAFTLASGDDRYSEFDLAHHAAKSMGLTHIRVDPFDDATKPLDRFLELSNLRNTPILTVTSFVSRYIALRASSLGVKVIMNGVGADEMFSGYYDYFFYRMMSESSTDSEKNDFESYVLPYIRNPILSKGLGSFTEVSYLNHHYFDSDFKSSFFDKSVSMPCRVTSALHGISYLRSRMYSDLSKEVVPIILHEDDLNYMSCSVENRSPFLSRNILKYSLTLDESTLMKEGFQKTHLRKVLSDNSPQLNNIYARRQKQGFNYSINDIFKSDPATFMDIVMNKTPIWSYLSRKNVEKYLSDSSSPKSESFVFSLLSMQAFMSSC